MKADRLNGLDMLSKADSPACADKVEDEDAESSAPSASGMPVSRAAPEAPPVKPASAPAVEVRTRDPRTLQYQVDGSTKQVVATIVDESNKVVVVQIPDAEVLRIAKAIDRMKGFLLEGKA